MNTYYFHSLYKHKALEIVSAILDAYDLENLDDFLNAYESIVTRAQMENKTVCLIMLRMVSKCIARLLDEEWVRELRDTKDFHRLVEYKRHVKQLTSKISLNEFRPEENDDE